MQCTHTVLIVDDEHTNIDFIVNNIGKFYHIKTAPNGKVALKILEKFQIDLILLDIQMPILDGYETAKEIKNNPKTENIPFIFLTSNTDSNSVIKGFELGAKDYVTKPFNSKELQVRVENHLKTYDLINKLEIAYTKLNNSYENLQKFIDTQDNIVFLTDGKTLHFANKKFYEFTGFENIEQFKRYHQCICENFIEHDRFFHLGKVKENQTWLEAIIELQHSQRVVTVIGSDSQAHAFSISINEFDEQLFIVSFSDISQTMIEHISLEKKIIHDNLTGAYNREYFEQKIKSIIESFTVGENHLGIALLDIDHFKEVNDNYGHDVGDLVLKHFVKSIQSFSRKEDVFIRWGGEEFVLLLEVESENDLFKALEHLRKVIQIQDFPKVGTKTCSIGGTIYQKSENIEDTIKRADQAVYEAKANGRNQVKIQ